MCSSILPPLSLSHWRKADICSAAPSLSGNVEADYAITPQLNLLFKDRMLQGGVGILSTYTTGGPQDDWTDLYWQFLVGLSFPVSAKLKLDVMAYYPFDSWGNLDQFEFEYIEYGAWIGYQF